MFDKLYYQDKGLFLQSFHPAAVLAYLFVLLLLSLLYDNPLYLLSLLLMLALLIRGVDGFEAWEGFLKAGVFLMLVVMAVNPLVIRAGATIIWHGPDVPFLGRWTFHGGHVFRAVRPQAAGDHERILPLQPDGQPGQCAEPLFRAAGKSVLMVALATRMFPTMVRDLKRIKEVMQFRGVDFEEGGLWVRVKKYSGLYNVMLLSSLEDSMEIAESMQARAYGSGRRSVYSRNLLRPRDYLSMGASLLALFAAAWGLLYGCGRYAFYPVADALVSDSSTLAALFVVLFYLSVPLILSEGCKYCRFIKSKI